MKRIKKHLSLWVGLGALMVASVVTPIVVCNSVQMLSTPQNQSHRKALLTNLTQNVDYSQVRQSLKDNFTGDKLNQQLVQSNLQTTNVAKPEQRTNEQLKKVHKLQTQYLDHFEKNNFSSDQIQNYLKKKSPQTRGIGDQFNKTGGNEATLKQTHLFSTPRTLQFSARDDQQIADQRISKLSEIPGQLIKVRNALVKVGAASGIAAAGFYAATWWLGATLPWAVACTAISATCCLGATILYAEGNNWNIDWQKVLSSAKNVIEHIGKISGRATPLLGAVLASVELVLGFCQSRSSLAVPTISALPANVK